MDNKCPIEEATARGNLSKLVANTVAIAREEEKSKLV